MRLRVLAPSRLRRALLSRLDARYVTKPDHRQDLKDALWDVQMLRREIVALREEVERLRRAAGASSADSRAADSRAAEAHRKATEAHQKAADAHRKATDVNQKAAEAHRLATETADAVDTLLQNEVRIWQAIDDLSDRTTAPGRVG